MSEREAFFQRWSPYVLSVLRIMAAALFMQHGTMKILQFPEATQQPEILTLGWIAGVLELFGGALLLIGLGVRPVAFVLSGMMAVAYFMVHAPNGFYPILNRGELAALYCFVFLYFTAAGGGPWSLDRLFRRAHPAHAMKESESRV